MFCFVFIASAQPTPAENWLNENGQLPVVDALWDQTEGKRCLSYKINSIFSGSCVQNNNYYISTAVFYSATNWMSHSPLNSQTIVSIPLLIQRKRECLPQGMWPWDGEKADKCTPPFVVPRAPEDLQTFQQQCLWCMCVGECNFPKKLPTDRFQRLLWNYQMHCLLKISFFTLLSHCAICIFHFWTLEFSSVVTPFNVLLVILLMWWIFSQWYFNHLLIFT